MRRGAIGVIFREQRLLVIRRSASVVAPLAYCFPGGAIEAGETEPQALIRELHEELRVRVRPIRQLWLSVSPSNVLLAWWLAELPAEATPLANPAEVESVHWLSPEEIQKLPGLLDSNRRFLEALRLGEIVLDVTT